jgi:hypothetical protein
MPFKKGGLWHALRDGYALCNPSLKLYGKTGISDDDIQMGKLEGARCKKCLKKIG